MRVYYAYKIEETTMFKVRCSCGATFTMSERRRLGVCRNSHVRALATMDGHEHWLANA